MTAERSRRAGALNRATVTVVVSLALLAAGVGAREMVESENAQAHALVAEGERALARNERPAAVLSLERARWLAPRAQFVRAAVETAGVHDVESLLPRALRLLAVREWSAIATFFGWASAFGVVFTIVAGAQHGRRRARQLALAAGCASVIGMAGVVEASSSSPAIVTSADTSLLVAPYAGASAEGPLPAGAMVLVGPHYDAFVRVRDADGRAGWVPRASVEPIAASGS